MIAKFDNISWHLIIVAGLVVALATWNPVREHELPADTPWHLLMQTENVADPIVPSDTLRSLDGQSILLTGFMYPLESDRDQQHFLLSPFSPSCPFHEHGGPVYTVEVFAEESVRFTYEAVAVQGVFSMAESEGGIHFQLHEATVGDLP